MQNEHHDHVANDAAVEAYDLGFDSLHVLSADEILMRKEDQDDDFDEMRQNKALCLLTLITSICHSATSVKNIRDRLACIVMLNAPDILHKIPAVWVGKVEWQAARWQLAQCPGVVWDRDAGKLLVEILTSRGWSPREVGLHALCFFYAFQPEASLRKPLAVSFDTIGQAVGLTATNKRSAVSAAMQRVVLELIKGMQRRTRKRATAEFWFMKRAHCRNALSVSMLGKTNRKGKGKKQNKL